MPPRSLASPANRGILADLLLFGVNLLLMRRMARAFLDLCRAAGAGDGRARTSLAVFLLALLVLPAAGAVLKRWTHHQRQHGREGEAGAWGCVLNPAFYLAGSLLVATSAGVLLFQRVYGDDFSSRGDRFLPMMAGVLVLSITQTLLVYAYFSPPRRPPRLALLRDPRADALGDLCIFVNMVFYQMLWSAALSGRPALAADLETILGRIFVLWLFAILIYFPPRIFYLAEDGKRRASWASMALATLPPVLRMMGVI
jgi:hypothetical protein